MGSFACSLDWKVVLVRIRKMFRNAFQRLTAASEVLAQQAKRNIGVSAAASQKANLDPIQQLFIDKIREYKTKSVGGKLVDASPETEAMFKGMLQNLEGAYSAKGKDMTSFPSFTFTDPEILYPGLAGEQKEKLEAAAKAAEAVQAEADAEPGPYDDWHEVVVTPS